MGFIADSIRIAKDGSVTSTADSAASVVTIKKVWTAKIVCAELCMIARMDVITAKWRMLDFMLDHNFNHGDMDALMHWMDQNWGTGHQTKIATLVDFFQTRCP